MTDYSEEGTPSHPPATQSLAEAIDIASEALEYHERRMGKRLRALKGEDPEEGDDEPGTGVHHLPPPVAQHVAPQRRMA
jgi:hypothetical protein